MDGYRLAKALGHHRTVLYPSLVQLKTDPTYPRALKGIKAECGITVRRGSDVVAENRGEVLFTEYGVSGPAIFDISRAVSTGGEGLICQLNFFPDWERREVLDWLRLRRQVAASVSVAKGVYICDDIASPFILGVLHPRIYLPSGLTGATLESVLRHERAHLKRRDHWWKPLAHVLIAVYWFNPLLWAAYVLLCRDIELACDERVVRDMTREDRAAYSQALLQCSLNRRRRLVLCPLAFGEVGVRTRVKSVLRYRRPAVWLSAAAVLLCVALAVTFLTEPKTAENAPAEKARTHNNDYVDYFQRIQKKEAQQGRSVDNPVVIISTSMEPATGQISYQVQLLDGMTDWEKERILSRYSMNIANMEVFYPQEGDIYQEMDVPHLRFRAVSSTFAPPIDPAYDDLVALDNPYEPYTLASVTVLSADGSQSSTFRRVGQSLLLDDAPDDSGRNAISWSIRID